MQELSNMFLKIKRKDDIVIRYGGSEFIIIFDDIRPDLDFQNLMSRYRERTKLSMSIDGEEFILSYNTGVAFMPDDGNDVRALVEKADRALNQAKREGKGKIKFYGNLEEVTNTQRLKV